MDSETCLLEASGSVRMKPPLEDNAEGVLHVTARMLHVRLILAIDAFHCYELLKSNVPLNHCVVLWELNSSVYPCELLQLLSI